MACPTSPRSPQLGLSLGLAVEDDWPIATATEGGALAWYRAEDWPTGEPFWVSPSAPAEPLDLLPPRLRGT